MAYIQKKLWKWTKDVELSHQERCKEQEHAWRGAMSIFLGVYQVCKWCGVRK